MTSGPSTLGVMAAGGAMAAGASTIGAKRRRGEVEEVMRGDLRPDNERKNDYPR